MESLGWFIAGMFVGSGCAILTLSLCITAKKEPPPPEVTD